MSAVRLPTVTPPKTQSDSDTSLSSQPLSTGDSESTITPFHHIPLTTKSTDQQRGNRPAPVKCQSQLSSIGRNLFHTHLSHSDTSAPHTADSTPPTQPSLPVQAQDAAQNNQLSSPSELSITCLPADMAELLKEPAKSLHVKRLSQNGGVGPAASDTPLTSAHTSPKM